MANNYYDNIKAGRLDPRADVQAEAARARQEVADTADEATSGYNDNERNKNVFESASMIPAAQRAYERRGSQFEPDLDFKVDDDMRMAWDVDYNNAEIEDLQTARSDVHLLQIKKDIEEDRARAQVIASYGTSGIIQTVAVALLDPPALAMMAMTGGYSSVATGGRTLRALKVAGATAVELGVYEALLEAGDTQKQVNDIYVGLAFGGFIGGGIGALTKAKAGKSIADMDSSITKDAERAGVVNAERELVASGEKPLTTKNFDDPNVDTVAVNKAVKDHEVSLNAKADGTITETGADGSKKRRQVASPRALQSAIKAFEKKKEVIVKAAKAKLKKLTNSEGVAKVLAKESEEAATLIKSKAKTEASFAAEIAKAENKVKQFESNAAKQDKFYKANEALQAIIKRRDSAIRILENNSKSRLAKLREAQLGARNAAAAKLEKDLAKLDNAITKMKKDSEIARTSNAAKSKLKKWNKMTPSEKAIEATKGKIPLMNLNAQKLEMSSTTTTNIAEDVVGDSASSMKVGDRGSNEIYEITAEEQSILHKLLEEGSNIDESLIGTQVYSKLGQHVADRLQALHTTLGNSNSFVVRGLNHLLFESAQGGKARGLTASSVAENNKRQILGAMRGRLTEGFEAHIQDFAKGNPKKVVQGYTDPVFRSDFNKQVMLKIENPLLQTSEAVTHAADGVRDLYKKSAEISKDSGRQGFQNLKVRDNYITKVINPTLYKRVVAMPNMGAVKAKLLLSKGYQEGYYKLGVEAADRLADARHIQLTEGNLTMRGALSKYGASNVDQMKKDLKAAGVEDSVIDDLLENTLAKDLEQGISDRAKKSLDPSLTAEVDGVKLVDIIDNDLGSMTEGYARETAGEAALAQVVGAKTVAQMDRILVLAEKALSNSGRMSEKRIAEEMLMLQDGVKMLLGKSINPDAGSSLVSGLSRMRDLTGLLRLQNMGLASIPETARAITSYGLSAVLESVPNLGVFSSKKARGGKMSNSFERADLEELDEVMAYYGDDWALHDQSIRYESFEDIGQTGKFTQLFDTAMAQGRRLQGITSGFRTIQGAGEKIALRSLASRLKGQLLHGKKPLKDWQINDAGWSATTSTSFKEVDGVMQRVVTTSDFMDDVSKWMKANPKQATVNGRQIDVFNFENMPSDMQQRLQVGMQRLVYRDMQRMNVGETSTFMNKWLGQTLFQFRGFPLASVEKQLAHDIKADKIHAANTMMVSAGMAYMAMGIQTSLNSLSRPDDDYVKNNMTGSNAILQVMGRMGQTSALSLVGDGLATLGLLPDEMYSGQGRMGYKAIGADYIPAVGVASDATTMAADMIGLLQGEDNGNKVARGAQGLVPFMKTIGVGQAISITIKED